MMATYLVSLWADDMIPVALYSDRIEAESFREKLVSHYKLDKELYYEMADGEKHDPSVAAVLAAIDLTAATVFSVKVLEFDVFGGFRNEVSRVAAHQKVRE